MTKKKTDEKLKNDTFPHGIDFVIPRWDELDYEYKTLVRDRLVTHISGLHNDAVKQMCIGNPTVAKRLAKHYVSTVSALVHLNLYQNETLPTREEAEDMFAKIVNSLGKTRNEDE